MTDNPQGLTHLNAEGEARMVDVSPKQETVRVARAQAQLRMNGATLDAILAGDVAKGDVFGTARIAGIMAAKRCSELIPLCHPLRLTKTDLRFRTEHTGPHGLVFIEVEVKAKDRTGVEMEALTAASVAALTVYDMAKAIDRWMVIEAIQLMEKQGGKSGHVQREGRA